MWEYRSFTIKCHGYKEEWDAQKKLKELGEEGWEIILLQRSEWYLTGYAKRWQYESLLFKLKRAWKKLIERRN